MGRYTSPTPFLALSFFDCKMRIGIVPTSKTGREEWTFCITRLSIQLALNKCELLSSLVTPAHCPPTDPQNSKGLGSLQFLLLLASPACPKPPAPLPESAGLARGGDGRAGRAGGRFLDGARVREPLEAAVFLARSREGEWKGATTHTQKRRDRQMEELRM